MNIQAGIKRLDELASELPNGIAQFKELREILLSMSEPEDKKVKIGGYQELALRIVETNKRIGGIEERIGTTNFKPRIKVKIEEIERRLAELEQPQWTTKQLNALRDGKSVCFDGVVVRPEDYFIKPEPSSQSVRCDHGRRVYGSYCQYCGDFKQECAVPSPSVGELPKRYCDACDMYIENCKCKLSPSVEYKHDKSSMSACGCDPLKNENCKLCEVQELTQFSEESKHEECACETNDHDRLLMRIVDVLNSDWDGRKVNQAKHIKDMVEDFCIGRKPIQPSVTITISREVAMMWVKYCDVNPEIKEVRCDMQLYEEISKALGGAK